MKKLFLILLVSFISFSASAQKLFHAAKTNQERNILLHNPPVGYNQCQANQNIIYKETLRVLEAQILKLLIESDEGSQSNLSSHHLKMYNKILIDRIFHHIIVTQLKLQLERISLYQRYLNSTKYTSLPMLEIEEVEVNIGPEVSKILSKVLTTSKTRKVVLSIIETRVFSELFTQLMVGAFKKFLAKKSPELLVAIAGGSVSKEGIKKILSSATLNISKSTLMTVGRGSFLSLLAYPLHGYTYHPEAEWLNTLEVEPLLILNPDWSLAHEDDRRTLGRRSTDQWRTHCLAIVRSAKSMENRLLMLRQKLEKDLDEALLSVRLSQAWDRRDHSELDLEEIDGTAVHKSRRLDIAK